MSNEIKVFSNEEFGKVRTTTINGKIYFSAVDVAKALGYSNPRDAISRHCKGVVKHDGVSKTVNQYGVETEQVTEMNFIPEGDIYRLIMKSQLPSAERFEMWVCDDVLPSLRSNGGYMVGQEQMTPEQLIANALVVANRIISEKDEQIKELSPKGRYFDKLIEKKLLTTLRDTAKEFNIAPQTFNRWLLERGYIYKDRHKMIKPVARYVKEGLFQMKDFMTPAGYANVQTYVTVKGKETFRLLLEVETNDD